MMCITLLQLTKRNKYVATSTKLDIAQITEFMAQMTTDNRKKATKILFKQRFVISMLKQLQQWWIELKQNTELSCEKNTG